MKTNPQDNSQNRHGGKKEEKKIQTQNGDKERQAHGNRQEQIGTKEIENIQTTTKESGEMVANGEEGTGEMIDHHRRIRATGEQKVQPLPKSYHPHGKKQRSILEHTSLSKRGGKRRVAKTMAFTYHMEQRKLLKADANRETERVDRKRGLVA